MKVNYSRKNLYFLPLLLFLLLLTTINNYGQIQQSDSDLLNTVSKQLLAAVKNIPKNHDWPPVFKIEQTDDLNAWAQFNPDNENGFMIVVTSTMFDKVIQSKSDRLAYILGHELNHILCGHLDAAITPELRGSKNVVRAAYDRDQEKEADIEGLKLTLKAGFSKKGALTAFTTIREISDYTPIEALSYDHPSWTERLAYVDNAQATLWRSMSAFENGVYFLFFENYDAAIACFEKVRSEFPSCYEASANLGYAYLMMYFDAFDYTDLKDYNIGQIVIGGFYRRPASLEARTRGVNENLWWDAVGYLKEALRINPNLSLVKANLGIAYLLHPQRSGVGDSEKYLSEAISLIEQDKTLDPALKATVYLNAGVTDLAMNNIQLAVSKLEQADKYSQESPSHGFGYQGTTFLTAAVSYSNSLIENAISFNKIVINLKNPGGDKTNKESAAKLYDYLCASNPASIWWTYAYELYSDLCKKINSTPKSKESIIKNIAIHYKPVRSISFSKPKITIYPSQKITEVKKVLGEGEVIPVNKERKIYKYVYQKLGLEIVGGEEVIAITLINSSAPQIVVAGVDNSKTIIPIGMSKTDLKKTLKGIYADGISIPWQEKVFSFYSDIGIAVGYQDDLISEIIIIQPPRK